MNEGSLYGETLVFTGTLSLPRKEAAKIAASIGCHVDDSVTKCTTILVVGTQDALNEVKKHFKINKEVPEVEPEPIPPTLEEMAFPQRRFVRPSIHYVRDFFQENGFKDADEFYGRLEKQDWRDRKNNPIEDNWMDLARQLYFNEKHKIIEDDNF